MKKKIKWELEQKSKEIGFNEDAHVYYDRNNEYISVTTLIKKYVPSFDPTGDILKRCAMNACLTPDEMKERWDAKKNAACAKGTRTHMLLEHISLDIPVEQTMENSALKRLIAPFFKDLVVLSTEQIIYDKKKLVSGMIDLITINSDDSLSLYDYKTNEKDIECDKTYGTLLKPLTHLFNNTLTKYALQLSIYRFMLEKWGYEVRDSYLVQLNGRLKVIPVPYLKDEVELIFGDFD